MGFHFVSKREPVPTSGTTASRHAKNYCLLASRHIDLEEWREARTLLQRALALSPEYREALRMAANIEFTTGNTTDARIYLNRILTQPEPADADTLFLLGNLELGEGNLVEALAAYEQAFTLGEGTPELEFNTGLAHLMLGHSRQAIEVFSRLIDEMPTNGRAWDALGCAQRLEKRYEEATHAFLQSLQVEPLQNDPRDHLAQMLLEMGNPEQARAVLETALSIEADRATSRHLLGLAFATLQDFPRAIECWEAVLLQGPAPAETYHLLANAHLHVHDHWKAMQVLNALVRLYPDHLPGHLQLALLLLEQGELEDGWRHLEEARAIDPQNPTVMQLVSAATAMRRQRG